MEEKIVINPDYEHLRSYIESIPEKFDSLGTVIKTGRNTIRKVEAQGVTLVIKSFRQIYLTHRIRYSTYYPSKAHRAYDNAVTLVENGFNTPNPIAYIEIKQFGLLSESFFISEYIDFKPLEDVFKPFEKDVKVPSDVTTDLLRQLAHYTYKLHQKGIYHIDYTLGNILYKKDKVNYQFALVDNNRMKFGSLYFKSGIKNMERLWLTNDQLSIIAREYAGLWKVDENKGFEYLLQVRKREAFINDIRRIMKRLFKSLIGKK
jgi:serine/threonine protein kinase